MKNYIKNQKSVKISEILNKENIISPSRFNKVILKNKNFNSLSNLINTSKNSINILKNKGYYQYVEIGDINPSTGSINYKRVRSIDISSPIVFKLKSGDILISTIRTYLGGIALVNKSDSNMVSTKALIVLRNLKKEFSRYYLFGVLRSSFFIGQTNLILNASMYPRMERDELANIKIPFPTKKNHPHPEKIEKYVSLIVQNIMDKEEQIKEKNKLISEKIGTELKENQKQNNFKFNYPKIFEIKKELRLDTGIYEKEFKEIDNLLRNYKNGFFQLPFKNIKTGQTPKDYYYPKEKKTDEVYLWLSPRNLGGNTLKEKLWIHTKNENTLKNQDLIFGSRGTVGDVFFYDEKEMGKTYINQSTSGIFIEGKIYNKIFVICYFSSSIFKKVISKYIYKGTVPAITPDVLIKFLIPNFSKEKQKEIAKSYYNKLDKNKDLNLDNYLGKEFKRNKEIGIFQLNMEIFKLRELLEGIIDKIVMDKKIEIYL